MVFVAALMMGVTWSPRPIEAQDSPHAIRDHKCNFCHGLHKGQGPSLIKKMYVSDVCRDCHSALKIFKWKQTGLIKDDSGGLLGPGAEGYIDPNTLLPPPPIFGGGKYPSKFGGKSP